ncbi:MAG: hypothetical protein FWJ70_14950 [Micromonosporaceae bacterium]
MAKTIQIRNVPDDVHKMVRARAERAGTSVADYLRALITELASHPTIVEILEPRSLTTVGANGGAAGGQQPQGTRTPVPRRS